MKIATVKWTGPESWIALMKAMGEASGTCRAVGKKMRCKDTQAISDTLREWAPVVNLLGTLAMRHREEFEAMLERAQADGEDW
jgi:hypothetical protein